MASSLAISVFETSFDEPRSRSEGFGRYTRPEFRRFIIIARGSAAEVQSQLYLARDLGYLSEAEHQGLNARCLEISRMLAALRTSLDPH